jgi:hypothetical protein
LGFGLQTATPLQRAICWALQGEEVPAELWNMPMGKDMPPVSEAFGGVMPPPGATEVLLLCGVRGAKTLIASAACVWHALTADLSGSAGLSMRAGEIPRVSLVSRLTDNAREAYNYIVGAFASSWALKPFLAREPKADLIELLHPSGQRVAIKVIAMTGSGVSLVSRWAVSVIFDEAPRMASEDDGVVNLEEQVRAVRSRLIRGGKIMYIGSPYGAKGFVYDIFEKNWKKPAATVAVVKALGFWMNPIWWTPERCRELEATAPDDYRVDVLAEFRDPESQLFGAHILDAILRKEAFAIPYESGKRYVAVMDPAATTNAWTFGVAESPDNRKFTVVYTRQWKAAKHESLSPKAVLTEIKDICDAYKVPSVLTDQYSSDALRDIAADLGLGLASLAITVANKTRMWLALLTRAESGLLDVPNVPNMRQDFMNVVKRLGRGTQPQIVLKQTADGRHADYAAMLALLCGGYLDAYELDAPPEKRAVAKMYWELTEEEREDLEDREVLRDMWQDDEPLHLMDSEY